MEIKLLITLILILIFLIILLSLIQNSTKSLNNKKSLKNNKKLFIPENNPIVPNNNPNQQSFMSIEQNPSFLLNNTNGKFRLFKYDGQNKTISQSQFHYTDNGLTINDYGINYYFIPAPLKIMNIKLNELKNRGGLYYGWNNELISFDVIENCIFKLGNHILKLIEPYAETREINDKIMYFIDENGLIGKIHGYRDKNQDFNIEWIQWSKNNQYFSYGTLTYKP